MDLDIRKMVVKAHCYADNYLADNLSKWYALRKAYADGYKEAFNDIKKCAEEESNHDVMVLFCPKCGSHEYYPGYYKKLLICENCGYSEMAK